MIFSGISKESILFFWRRKKELINLFIDECFQRDGGKEEIKRKLLKIGYKI